MESSPSLSSNPVILTRDAGAGESGHSPELEPEAEPEVEAEAEVEADRPLSDVEEEEMEEEEDEDEEEAAVGERAGGEEEVNMAGWVGEEVCRESDSIGSMAQSRQAVAMLVWQLFAALSPPRSGDLMLGLLAVMSVTQ